MIYIERRAALKVANKGSSIRSILAVISSARLRRSNRHEVAPVTRSLDTEPIDALAAPNARHESGSHLDHPRAPSQTSTAPHLTGRTMTVDPYAFAAGYYDLFRARPGSWPPIDFFADLAPAGGQALEIGPGTGRITLPVAERAAGVYCVERSATMRAVLLAKLAARPDLRDRVTVLAGTAPEFDLARKFDYVYFAGVLEHIPPQARPALFRTVAAHLVPGGTLAMDMVLDLPALDEPEHHLDAATLGECRYELTLEMRSRGPDLTDLRYVYRTYHQNRLVATEVVQRAHNFHRREAVLRDLATAGLVMTGGSVQHGPADGPGNPGTLVARFAPTAMGRTDTAVPSTAALGTGGQP